MLESKAAAQLMLILTLFNSFQNWKLQKSHPGDEATMPGHKYATTKAKCENKVQLTKPLLDRQIIYPPPCAPFYDMRIRPRPCFAMYG